jgi:plastocyanin
MRKLIAAALAVAVAGMLAATAVAATKTVKVGDIYFVKPGKPRTVTVSKGTTVKWRWVGKLPHNVTVTQGPVKFKSSTKTSGSYSKKLTKKGTYKLMCTVHGAKQSMTLKVN